MTDAANMKTNEVSQQNEKRKGAANNKKGTAKKKRSKEQMEKDQEKMKRYRKRQMYEKQIETLEGGVGKFAEKVDVWVSDIKTGSFQKLTQVTRMANVRNMSPFLLSKNLKPANLKPAQFQGDIVALGKLEDRNYKAIPESYFKVNEPCSAQQAVTGNAKYSDAQRQSDVCHPVKGVTGGWVRVK